MLRRNISGRRRCRNLAGATNGQLRFNTTVAGWTVTSPPHSYFFLWNPQSGTTSGTSADNSGSNPLPRAGAKADRQRNVGAAGFVTDRNASNISPLSDRRRCAL